MKINGQNPLGPTVEQRQAAAEASGQEDNEIGWNPQSVREFLRNNRPPARVNPEPRRSQGLTKQQIVNYVDQKLEGHKFEARVLDDIVKGTAPPDN